MQQNLLTSILSSVPEREGDYKCSYCWHLANKHSNMEQTTSVAISTSVQMWMGFVGGFNVEWRLTSLVLHNPQFCFPFIVQHWFYILLVKSIGFKKSSLIVAQSHITCFVKPCLSCFDWMWTFKLPLVVALCSQAGQEYLMSKWALFMCFSRWAFLV